MIDSCFLDFARTWFSNVIYFICFSSMLYVSKSISNTQIVRIAIYMSTIQMDDPSSFLCLSSPSSLSSPSQLLFISSSSRSVVCVCSRSFLVIVVCFSISFFLVCEFFTWLDPFLRVFHFVFSSNKDWILTQIKYFFSSFIVYFLTQGR